MEFELGAALWSTARLWLVIIWHWSIFGVLGVLYQVYCTGW